jgi:hypothetical protein
MGISGALGQLGRAALRISKEHGIDALWVWFLAWGLAWFWLCPMHER